MIQLTDEMRRRLSTALVDGHPVISASVHPDGRPKLSYYGSTQVFDDDTLAIWVRDPNAGLLDRITTNPHMAFTYYNTNEWVYWQFEGRAAVNDDPAVRDRVYEAAPEPERAKDPDRKGAAVLVTLDRVAGRDVLMERD
jgi:predicted pyridoxine 5'-phosphate oxidase superfamily flavin-nucleotide-binding protein